ncbi:MAG: TatD family hydrolase [Clostridia bacterium]|nr:TatD family hydrolase [Clostridia bacterium]
MSFFDSHAHYNDEVFKEDKDKLIKAMYKDGITNIICAGYSLEKSKEAINIAKSYPHIFATCGISPNDINENVYKEIEEIEKIARDDKVLAIGEIGLDYYWNKDNKQLQKDVFSKQIDIANKLNLPIVIHSRDAWIDTIDVLKSNPVDKKGVFHCCQLNQELIKEALKLDFYISFSGNITFKNAKSDECIKLVPDNKILIETDSPYLSPEPFRGTRNNSLNVKLVAKKIAEVKGMDIQDIANITKENTMRIFMEGKKYDKV